MTEIEAVFENGVFRPTGPVALADGQAVRLTVTPSALPPPTPAERDYLARLNAAKTLEEMFAVMATAPPDPDCDYDDLMREINETRRQTGFRMPDPEPPAAGPQ